MYIGRTRLTYFLRQILPDLGKQIFLLIWNCLPYATNPMRCTTIHVQTISHTHDSWILIIGLKNIENIFTTEKKLKNVRSRRNLILCQWKNIFFVGGKKVKEVHISFLNILSLPKTKFNTNKCLSVRPPGSYSHVSRATRMFECDCDVMAKCV